MPDPTPSITDAIRENALGLKKASNDAGSGASAPPGMDGAARMHQL
jgi:hypothetical protein